VIIRVVNQSALTSNTIATGTVGSIHFASQGKSTVGNVTLPDAHPTSSVASYGEILDKSDVAAETTTSRF
jgi:hypothetical protein